MRPELDSIQSRKPNLPDSVKVQKPKQSEDSLKLFVGILPDDSEKITFVEFDIDTIIKEHKKNPADALRAIGIDFDEKQTRELKKLIKNEKSLKAFLKLIHNNEKLTKDDIVEGMKSIDKFQAGNVVNKAKNIFKTLIDEGIVEAWEQTKSAKGYYSKRLGKNMNEIRAERTDFTSKGVVQIAETNTLKPELKSNMMHFVSMSQKDDSKLYTEQDVLKARSIMLSAPKDAQEFTDNAIRLESIKGPNGFIKYKGSTIIDVDKKMIENKSVKETMFNAAMKTDMNDQNLVKITSNIAENNDIATIVDSLLNKKNKNGNDVISAENLCSYTNEIKKYNSNELSTINNKIEETYNNNIAKQPDFEFTKENLPTNTNININNNQTNSNTQNTENNAHTEQINQYSNTTAGTNNDFKETTENIGTNNNNQNTEIKTTNNTTIPSFEPNIKSKFEAIKFTTNENNNNKSLDEEIVVVNGTKISKTELESKFGATYADKIIEKIKNEPEFMDKINAYNGNATIVEALIENPELIDKIKKSNSSLTINELAEIVKICTDESTTKVMQAALEYNSNVNEAIKITNKSKIMNVKDDAITLLNNSNVSKSVKKEQLNELYFTGKNQSKRISYAY